MAMPLPRSNSARRIATLIDRLARLSRELQFAEGLNPAQWEALRFLAQANEQSRTPSAVAEYLGATKGTASQTLIALENKGLISRNRCTVDKRQRDLALTAAGEALLGKDPINTLGIAADGLLEDDSQALVRGLTRLLHDVQMVHGVRTFGVCADCSLRCVEDPQPSGEAAVQRCGVTGEPIRQEKADQLCINFRPLAGSAGGRPGDGAFEES